MPRYGSVHDDDDDDDDDDFDDNDCAECTLPCLFLLGPAAVFFLLGARGLHDWSYETDWARNSSLTALHSAVARWEKHRPALGAVKLTVNLSSPGQPAQVVELVPSHANEGGPPIRDAPKWEPLRFEAMLPVVRSWRHPYVADLHFSASGPTPGARSAFSVSGVEMTQLHTSHAGNWKECAHQRHGHAHLYNHRCHSCT